MQEQYSFLFDHVFGNLKLSGPCEEFADWDKIDSLAGWMEPRLDFLQMENTLPPLLYDHKNAYDSLHAHIKPNVQFGKKMAERIRLAVDLGKSWCNKHKKDTIPLVHSIFTKFSTRDLVAALEEALLPGAPQLLDTLYYDPMPNDTRTLDIAATLPHWNIASAPNKTARNLSSRDHHLALSGNPGVYVDIKTPYIGSSFQPFKRWGSHRHRGLDSKKGPSRRSYYSSSSRDNHHYILLLHFPMKSNTTNHVVAATQETFHEMKGSRLGKSDSHERCVTRALAFIAEFAVMVALGHYCRSGRLETLAAEEKFPLRDIVPLRDRHNLECALENWQQYIGESFPKRQHIIFQMFDLGGTGYSKVLTHGPRYRKTGDPYIRTNAQLRLLSLRDGDKDGAKHLHIKLPLDLRHIKTLEESKRAIPGTSQFWIRLTQPLLNGHPQLSGFELIWTRTNWPTQPPNEPTTITLSMDNAKDEQCVCGGYVDGRRATWEDSVKQLHEYLCVGFREIGKVAVQKLLASQEFGFVEDEQSGSETSEL